MGRLGRVRYWVNDGFRRHRYGILHGVLTFSAQCGFSRQGSMLKERYISVLMFWESFHIARHSTAWHSMNQQSYSH